MQEAYNGNTTDIRLAPAGRQHQLQSHGACADAARASRSAIFTDDAFNRNMELGVLVKDPAAVSTLDEHFKELIRVGALVAVTRGA